MSDAEARSTRPSELGELPQLTDEEIEDLESQNGLRQFDRVVEVIAKATRVGAPSFRLRPSLFCELQQIAVEGLEPSAGTFRTGPVGIGGSGHEPPSANHVPRLVEDLCDYVNDKWAAVGPVHLGAYVMWKTNWIHPFTNGNGRTSRAVAYLVFCIKLGYLVPGSPTVPELIVRNKLPYYYALEAADAAALDGTLDVSAMEALFAEHLRTQLESLDI